MINFVSWSETIYDIHEGWSCVEIFVDGVNVGVWDDDNGFRVTDLPDGYEGSSQDLKYEIHRWFEQNGFPQVDYSLAKEATQRHILSRIIEEHGNMWVVMQNGYEKPHSQGFSNTYCMEESEEGGESRHGWEKATRLKDLNRDFWAEEIIEFFKDPDNGYDFVDYIP